jgi:hypothetical protein
LTGIDGNRGFGLPPRPSQAELFVFGGGADHVVYPGCVLKIAKIEQYPKSISVERNSGPIKRWRFEKLTLTAQVAAEDFASETHSRSIDAEDTQS